MPPPVGGAAVCGAATCGAAPPCGAAPAARRLRGAAGLRGGGRAGVAVVVFLGLGALEQSCVMKPLRQFVRSFHFFWKSLTKSLSAFCWFCEVSSWLIVVLRLLERLLRGGVIFVTSKT